MNLLHSPHFQQWIVALIAGLLLAIFIVLWVAKQLEQKESDEAYQRYFKRLDDTDGRSKK